MMQVERLAQSETYYPMYQESDTGVTAVAFGIRRFSDGYWYDFNDTTFKDTGWTTKHQALAEDDDGLWTYDTGLAIPDSNNVYSIQFKVTDASGTFYTQGPKIIINNNVVPNSFNDPTAAAIADAVWDEASTGHTDAGKAGEQLWTDIDAILVDTNELQTDWTNGGRLDLIIDELTSQGDTNEGKIDTVDTVVDAVKAVTDNLQLEATTNYIKSVPQDLEDVSIGDGDTLGSGYAGEVLRWLRWFIKNTWDVDTTPEPDEMNIYKDNGTTKGYCFQVYTSSNHNYRKVVACS